MKYPDDYINKIICGDCIEVMKEIPNGSVDMILCDLPYGTTNCKWDRIIPFDKLWKMVDYLLRPNGTFITTASQPFTSALVMSNPDMYKYSLVWLKTRPSNVFNAKKMFMKCLFIKENFILKNW